MSDWNELPQADGVVGDIQRHLPKPALIRATVFSVLSLAGVIFGKELSIPHLDLALDAYTLAVPAALGWWVDRQLRPRETTQYVGRHRKE